MTKKEWCSISSNDIILHSVPENNKKDSIIKMSVYCSSNHDTVQATHNGTHNNSHLSTNRVSVNSTHNNGYYGNHQSGHLVSVNAGNYGTNYGGLYSTNHSTRYDTQT